MRVVAGVAVALVAPSAWAQPGADRVWSSACERETRLEEELAARGDNYAKQCGAESSPYCENLKASIAEAAARIEACWVARPAQPADSIVVPDAGEPVLVTSGYAEPSALMSFTSPADPNTGVDNSNKWFFRFAAGIRIRRLAVDAATISVRIGLTGYVTGIRSQGYSDGAGVGAELEMDGVVNEFGRNALGVASRVRLGARVGVESARADTALLTAGPRLYLGETIWLAADAYYFTKSMVTGSSGALVGLGVSL